MPASRASPLPAGRAGALIASVLLHLGLLALATRPGNPLPARPAGDALTVVWIDPPAPAAATPEALPPRRTDTVTPPRATPDRRQTRVLRAAPAPTEPVPTPEPPRTGLRLEALVAQGASAAAGPGPDFRPDPLRPLPARPPPPPERIRMQASMTPARVLAAVGQLLGGPGYEADPCPRVRRNLGSLVTAGASDPALGEELHRLRTLCGVGD